MYTPTVDFATKMDKALRPALNVEIEYGQIDPDARDTAKVIEKVAEVAFSNCNQIIDIDRAEENVKVITLEDRETLLDGSFDFSNGIPMTDHKVGFRPSVMSDADGNFSSYPYVKVSTTDNINSIALCFTFSKRLNQYPIDFDVYVGDTVYSIINNSKVFWQSDFSVTGVKTIKIVIKKWCKGYTRPKLTQIDFGYYIYFTEDNLTDFSATNKFNPISTQISDGQIDFSFLNTDKSYNVFDLNAKQQFVKERQPITTRIGYENEMYKIGYFELSGKPTVTNSTVKLTGFTLSSKLSITIQPKLYQSATYYKIASDVFDLCGIEYYKIAESLKNTTITTVIEGTAKDIISNLCIANCLQFWQLDHCVYIGTLVTSDSGFDISGENEQNPTIDVDNVVKKIVCNYKTYKLGTTNEQLTTYTPTENGNFILSIPYSTNVTAINGTLTSSGLNYVTVQSTAGNQVEVWGNKLVVSELKANYEDTTLKDGITVSIESNSFITTATQANAVIDWIKTYYSKTQIIKSDWRQNPIIQIGDIIGIDTDFGNYNVVVEENTVTFKNGGLAGSTKGRCI